MDNKHKNKINKNDDDNNNSFLLRLFDIIDLPLFIFLAMVITIGALSTQVFFIEYTVYASGISILVGLFLKGLAGFRAAKDKESHIKPWLAGLSLAFVVSVFSIILTVVTTLYLPNPALDDTMTMLNSNSDNINEFDDEDLNTDEFEVIESQESIEINKFDIAKFAVIGGLLSMLFSCLSGALLGMLGGAIGRD